MVTIHFLMLQRHSCYLYTTPHMQFPVFPRTFRRLCPLHNRRERLNASAKCSSLPAVPKCLLLACSIQVDIRFDTGHCHCLLRCSATLRSVGSDPTTLRVQESNLLSPAYETGGDIPFHSPAKAGEGT